VVCVALTKYNSPIHILYGCAFRLHNALRDRVWFVFNKLYLSQSIHPYIVRMGGRIVTGNTHRILDKYINRVYDGI
jgi:hypothetical protein